MYRQVDGGGTDLCFLLEISSSGASYIDVGGTQIWRTLLKFEQYVWVSFMSEFHEVKCPEHIGRVAGNGWILIGVVLEFPQVGENSFLILFQCKK